MDNDREPNSMAAPTETSASSVSAATAIPTSGSAVADDIDVDVAATIHLSDLECALCCCLLFDPLTTEGCGHSFCRQCLARSLEIKRFCPLCRHPCHMDALSHPTTQLLATIAQRCFPGEYATRRAEAEAEGRDYLKRGVRAPRLGIFICGSPHFPQQQLQLHIFEPRYRIMISRAMATSARTFIVACADQQIDELEEQQQQQQQLDGANAAPAAAAAAAADGLQAVAAAAAAAAPPLGPADVALNGLPAGALMPMGAAHPMDPLRFHPPPFDPMRRAPNEVPPALRPLRDGDVACVFKILNVRGHVDGRSFVEAVGVQRVRLRDVRPEDEGSFGLLGARVEPIADDPEEGEEAAADAAAQAQAQPQAEREAADVAAGAAMAAAAGDAEHKQDDAEADEVPQSENAGAVGSGSGLRNRHRRASGPAANVLDAASSSAAAASSSSSSSTAGASSLDAAVDPVAAAAAAGAAPADGGNVAVAGAAGAGADDAGPSVAELVSECRQLLAQYCQSSGLSVERLASIHGGACPPDDRASELSWWLMRALPDGVAIKQAALRSQSLRLRLRLCVDLLHDSIQQTELRTRNQVRFVAVLILLAIVMILVRQYQR